MNKVHFLCKRIHTFAHGKRKWLNGSILEYILVGVLFVVLTAIYTNFVIFNISTQLFVSGPADGTGGFLWYNVVQPGLNPFLDKSNYVNYPFGENIGGPTFITYMLLWFPLRALSLLFGPVTGLNIMMFIAFCSTAITMYWLIKRLTSKMSIALFAAFAATYTPYAIIKSIDHLPYLFSGLFIVMLVCFISLWLRPTLPKAVLFGLSTAMAIYSDGYYLLIAPVFVLCLCIAGFMYSLLMRHKWRSMYSKLLYLSVSAMSLLLLMTPIIYLQTSQGDSIKSSLENRRSNIEAELKEYNASIVDFIVPAEDNPLLKSDKSYQSLQAYKNERSNSSESTVYISFVLWLLVVVGLTLAAIFIFCNSKSSLKLIDEDSIQVYILSALIFAISILVFMSFMFSPSIHIFGKTIPLIGQLFINYDITLWRVMTRFFVPLHVMFVFFAALTLYIIYKIIRINFTKVSDKILWAVVIVLAVIISLEYASAAHRPSYDFKKVEETYIWLRDQKNINSIAELPIVDPLDSKTALYVTKQITHKKKLLNSKEDTTNNKTNILGGLENKETIDWLYDRKVDAVVAREKACNSNQYTTLLHSSNSYDSNQKICIYSLKKPASSDKVFIKYKTDIFQRPNALNQDVSVLSGYSPIMNVVTSDYNRVNRQDKVEITLNIVGPFYGVVNSNWKVVQKGKIISSGDLIDNENNLKFTADAASGVQLVIDTDKKLIPPTSISLQNVIVTSSEDA